MISYNKCQHFILAIVTAPSVTCADIGLHYLYRYVKVCPVVFLASFRITTLV